MDRWKENQLDLFPFTTLGLETKRVVEGLIEEDGSADDQKTDAGEGDQNALANVRSRSHQAPPMPLAMQDALGVAMRPLVEQRRKATRAEFQGRFPRPKRRE